MAENSAPDIVIEAGQVPQLDVTEPRHIRSYIDGHPNHLMLDIPGKLRMRITDGNRLTYSSYPGVAEEELRLFLLGSGMGAILMQRGYIVVHGNAVALEGNTGALMCIGDSGAGKSTTAVAMMQRGLAILADDVCPLDDDAMAIPGMPRAKLWEDTAKRLGIDTAKLDRLRAGDAKFNLPLEAAHCDVPQRIRAFFWLVP